MKIKNLTLKFTLFFILTIAVLAIYSNFAIGYYKEYILFQNSIIEFLTIFIIYSIFFITLKGKNILYIPVVFLIIYIFIDLISNVYNRYIDFSDISNIPLLIDALLQSQGSVVYFYISIVLILILYIVFKYKSLRYYLFGFIFTAILFIMPIFIPNNSFINGYIKLYENTASYENKFWSKKKFFNYAKTGRISTFFYSGMSKSIIRKEIKNYLGNRDLELKEIKSLLKPHIDKNRNIYLIGLESFSLPKQLEKLNLKYIFNDKNRRYDVVDNSSVMITSIFGGGTIQSEFEALCGVPALQKVSAFEFTEFSGATTNCLPTILNSLGYDTVVSNTFKPQPSFEALKGVGFEDINFPREYFPNLNLYLSNKNISKGEYAIFDSDFFEQNSNYINKKYISKNRKVFNYMFSVWGHAFHEMTSQKRPKTIEILNAQELSVSEHTKLALNQEYYRIKALQNYFDNIKKSDPTALVIAFSDHRPVLDGADSYKKYGLKTDVFHNFIVIMDRGKYIKIGKPFPLYALPDIILDRLTNGWYCKHNKCKINLVSKERYLNQYYKIMANAMSKNIKNIKFYIYPSKLYYYKNPLIPFIGFSQPESAYRWSNAKRAEILFKVEDKKLFSGVLKLHISTLGREKIKIYLNGNEIYNKNLDSRDIILKLNFDINFLKDNSINRLTFILPNAHKPNSRDDRILALQFKYMKFEKK